MESYVKEFPGKFYPNKPLNEDSHYVGNIKAEDGKNWHLCLVMDGLSGYSGFRASHKTAKLIPEKIRDYLINNEPNTKEEIMGYIEQTVIKHNRSLQEGNPSRTTMSFLLTDGLDLYLLNMGDGGIYAATEDKLELIVKGKGDEYGPENFIGKTNIREVGRIEDRVPDNFVHISLDDHPDWWGFFVHTDGLNDYCSSEQVQKYFTEHCLNCPNPVAFVEALTPSETPNDDTTYTFVDLRNVVSTQLAELKRLHEVVIPSLDSGEYQTRLYDAKAENQRLADSVRSLERQVEELNKALSTSDANAREYRLSYENIRSNLTTILEES